MPEAQDSHEPYESVADGEFGPEDKRKAQLAPLDDLFAKDKTTVILDGQEQTVQSAECTPGMTAKNNVMITFEHEGSSANLIWEFTDPEVPVITEVSNYGTGMSLGFRTQRTSYSHIGDKDNAYALKGTLYSEDLSTTGEEGSCCSDTHSSR